ncbi:MAG: epoxyqueuosine reductase [Deltaproteobacteria bacterium]|nr:epoxyqueuosine reductase [Deltaproteobacteria bacterium]
MNAQKVKSMAVDAGADLVGIASVQRFDVAPEGFRPKDIFLGAQSVIAYAKRFPDGVFSTESPVPYTFASSVTLQEVFRVTYGLIMRLEDQGVTAMPIPSEPYEHWVEEKREGRGLMSLKHIGNLAGLGVIGKNTLLTNDQYGNLITLGAILVDTALQEDPIAEYSFCRDDCEICLRNCPAGALDGMTVDQKTCRERSQSVTKKGYSLYTRNLCRKICPNRTGIVK